MRYKYLWNSGLPKKEIHNIENGLYSDEQIRFLCETIMNSYRIRKKNFILVAVLVFVIVIILTLTTLFMIEDKTAGIFAFLVTIGLCSGLLLFVYENHIEKDRRQFIVALSKSILNMLNYAKITSLSCMFFY